MYYAELKKYDIANGPGVRVSLFVSGCTHYCKNCFNEAAWDFHYGNPFAMETEEEILDQLAAPYIAGLSILGGEPFEPENQRGLLAFVRRVRARFPEKTIWCYSGYLLEEELLKESRARCETTDELLSLIDILVDGEFVEEKKDITLRFRGSSNQRIIDVQKSLTTGSIVMADF